MPPYLRIADALRDDIEKLPIGEKLPGEPALAARWGVARATVGKAVSKLVDEGLLVRRQGAGTFVSEPPLKRQPQSLSSFSQSVAREGGQAGQVLVSAYASRNARVQGTIGEAKGFILERLRTVDGHPIAFFASVLPLWIVERAGLEGSVLRDESFSLYARLGAAGLTPSRAEETAMARLADEREADLLAMRLPAAVMDVQRRTFGPDDELLEVVDAVYAGGRYQFATRWTQEAGKGQTIDAI
jgi:GntR family transcriptional regulator